MVRSADLPHHTTVALDLSELVREAHIVNNDDLRAVGISSVAVVATLPQGRPKLRANHSSSPVST